MCAHVKRGLSPASVCSLIGSDTDILNIQGYMTLLVFLCSLVSFKDCKPSPYSSISDCKLHPPFEYGHLYPYMLAGRWSPSKGSQVMHLSASKLEYH